jgi:nucleotide-binding universal stress UspA family protein
MKTNKINKVLIALDYDPTAIKISEVGFTFAKAMNAEIVLVHVIVDLVAYSLTYLNMGPLQLESVMELKDASEQFLQKTKIHLGDLTIKTVVKEGDFAECILATAEELDVDVIVMGSHSRKWLENIVMGSVTEEVLRKTTVPMFIVPTKKREVKG